MAVVVLVPVADEGVAAAADEEARAEEAVRVPDEWSVAAEAIGTLTECSGIL